MVESIYKLSGNSKTLRVRFNVTNNLGQPEYASADAHSEHLASRGREHNEPQQITGAGTSMPPSQISNPVEDAIKRGVGGLLNGIGR
jgi:hypothetical protein